MWSAFSLLFRFALDCFFLPYRKRFIPPVARTFQVPEWIGSREATGVESETWQGAQLWGNRQARRRNLDHEEITLAFHGSAEHLGLGGY